MARRSANHTNQKDQPESQPQILTVCPNRRRDVELINDPGADRYYGLPGDYDS